MPERRVLRRRSVRTPQCSFGDDGVSFKFERHDGVPAALAYSGVITPVGIEAIASKHCGDAKLTERLL